MLVLLYAQQKMRDAEGGPHNATGTAEIQDERGTPEIHYQSTKAYGNKSNPKAFSSVSVKVTKRTNENEKPD
jgi:hypothetical protein